MKKDNTRSGLSRTLFSALLQLILGAILLMHPDFGSATVAMVIGWVLIAMGAVCVAVCIICWPALEWIPGLLGVAGVALGIYILANPLSLAKLFGIFAGVYLLAQGLGSLLECRLLRKAGFHFLTELVVGLAMVVLGAVLLFCPLSAARWLMTAFGIVMVVSGLVNLVIRAWAARKLRQPPQDPNIIDAE